ncbi:MAG: type IV secretion system DNA-binding domain-containing protein [Cyanobacteria bacterium J06638_22]
MTGKQQFTAGQLARRLVRQELYQPKNLLQPIVKIQKHFVPNNKPMIDLLGHTVELDQFPHMAFIGASGRGKTTGSGPTFHSIVNAITSGRGKRLIVVDIKGECLNWLEGMKRDYTLLSFTYKEGKAWAIAKDFPSYQQLAQLAYQLYPTLNGNNAFFRNAARAIVSTILMSLFHRHGTNWRFDDFVNLALSDLDTLVQVMKAFPRGSDILNTFLRDDDPETLYKVMSEVTSLIYPYLLVAAKSQRSPEISLTDFLEGEGILVIKLNPEKIELERPFLIALITRLFDLLISRPPTKTKDTVIWLEDWHFFGKFPRMERLSEMSRACGVSIVTLFQTIESLRSKESYGDQAESILANFPILTMLGTDSPITASWCARQFGRRWLREDVYTTSFGERGPHPTVREDRSVQDVVMDSAFLTLPPPSFENGYHCYIKSSLWGLEVDKCIPWPEILQRLPPSPDVPLLLHPIPPEWELPEPFSPERRDLMVSGSTIRASRVSEPVVSPFLSVFEEEVRKGLYQIAEDALQQIIVNEYERLRKSANPFTPNP